MRERVEIILVPLMRLATEQVLAFFAHAAGILNGGKALHREIHRGDLYRWLLDADLAMKGSSSSPPRARLVLEQLLVKIAVSSNVSLGPPPQVATLRQSG